LNKAINDLEGSPGKTKKYVDRSSVRNEQSWVKSHSVSFTFNKDEFLPNPDSKVWQNKGCVYDDYRNYSLDIV